MFNKKSIITTIVTSIAGLLFATSAAAAVDGVYLGGQLGYGNIYQPTLSFTSATDGNGGLAGRVYGGYQFTQYVAAELGYTKFSRTRLNFTDVTSINTYSSKNSVQTYALDLVAKGTLPLQNGFNVFGKLGLAFLNEYVGDTVLFSNNGPTTQENAYVSHEFVLPTFGLGAGYDFTKNLSTDVTWMRIQSVNTPNIDSTDTVTLGLSYHFG